MPRFAANLSMMYTEHAFEDRLAAAAADGFTGVEYLFPYAVPAPVLRRRLADSGLSQVLFNAPAGDWDRGERGIACLPGREAEFRDGLRTALEYAAQLECPRVHVMAGLAPAGAEPSTLRGTYADNLAWAADEAAPVGVQVLIEPINPRDMPGYYLQRQGDAHDVVIALGSDSLKVQMDLYHCQIVEGDLSARLRACLPTGRVGHIQVAGVPDRNEPDHGEVFFPHLFRLLDDLGYAGWVGCEYRPRAGTSEGLGWLRALRAGVSA